MNTKKMLGNAAVIGAAAAIGAKLRPQIKETLRHAASGMHIQRKAGDAVNGMLSSLSAHVSDEAIPSFFPGDLDDHFEGSGFFLSKPAANAQWRIGYAKQSILPYDIKGPLYLGGYLSMPPNRVSGVLDDLTVRATALSDTSGRGVHVFAAIDCVGLSNTDVRTIRGLLQTEVSAYNIESIQISATHCHSGVDTMGLWGDLFQALKKNPRLVKKKKTAPDAVSGKNPEFMDHLFQTVAFCVRKALSDMTPGTAEFAALDGSAFARDKRPPDVLDPTVTVVRFLPEGKKPLIWTVFGAHPTSFGSAQREISADYPYYLCRALENAGFEAAFFQGAEAAVATDRSVSDRPGMTRTESIIHYGEALAELVLQADAGAFKPLEPLLNIRISPVLLPAKNPLLLLAAKLKLVNNTLYKFPAGPDHTDYFFRTEVGYAEFGRDLRFALIPGELMPELVSGGTKTASESWSGADFPFPPMQTAVTGRLAVIGLCSDCIGYIVPDNDYGSFFAPLHYEEAVSPGPGTASHIVQAFLRTVESGRRSIADTSADQ